MFSMRKILYFFILFVVSVCPSLIRASDAPSYYIKNSIKVKDAKGRVLGELRLMEDLRLKGRHLRNPELDEMEADGKHPQTFGEAKLRYVGADGSLWAEECLIKPLATLSETPLEGQGRVFEVEVDYDAGFGQFSGPVSSFVRAEEGHWEWLKDPRHDEGKEGSGPRLSLMLNLSTTWRIQDANNILQASRRPHLNPDDSVVDFTRFHWDGKAWQALTRSKPGYREFEEDPPLSDFP